MIYLVGSLLFSILGATTIKISILHSQYSHFISVTGYIFYFVSFALLEYSLYYLEFGLVFIVWGVGTAMFLTIIGILFFGDPVTAVKIVSILLILCGISGLLLFRDTM